MRGKGIGAELINKLTEYGFNNLKKERIILNAHSWNIGAIKCYTKVGFSQTDKPIKLVKVGNEEWETIEMEKSQLPTLYKNNSGLVVKTKVRKYKKVCVKPKEYFRKCVKVIG